jgi:hypothetical protein
VDPAVKRTYGWRRKELVAHYHRNLIFSHPLTEDRLLAEMNIAGSQRGFGRLGADFWPVLAGPRPGQRHNLANRWPALSNWGQLSIKTTLLAPGPDGALSTVRFEMIRESLQECEARIFLEKALLDGRLRDRLGAALAQRCQRVLDERTRAALWGWHIGYPWFVGSGWQRRCERLFTLAAEAAEVVGSR